MIKMKYFPQNMVKNAEHLMGDIDGDGKIVTY